MPFFGVQALTMTLVNRLAERTGATVLYGWCERIGPDMEFALHIEPTDPAVADPDPQVAATALNAGIERIARRDPAQYQWTYKRYTLRPRAAARKTVRDRRTSALTAIPVACDRPHHVEYDAAAP